MNGCFIPKKIKVGFQERKDTYSGKLAWTSYMDSAGNFALDKENTAWGIPVCVGLWAQRSA